MTRVVKDALNARLWEILGDDESFFGRAFDWTKTTLGRDFWAKIDREWQEKCQTITK